MVTLSSDSSASASQIQMDYMKLLVTELRNQNPLEPMKNNEMAAQMAQFSQLQLTETMNSNIDSINKSFEKVLLQSQMTYAKDLIGDNVIYELGGNAYLGKVTGVGIKDGQINLTIQSELNDENGESHLYDCSVSIDNIKEVLGQD